MNTGNIISIIINILGSSVITLLSNDNNIIKEIETFISLKDKAKSTKLNQLNVLVNCLKRDLYK